MKRYVALVTPFGSVGIIVGKHGVSRILLTQRTVRQAERWFASMYPDARHDPDRGRYQNK